VNAGRSRYRDATTAPAASGPSPYEVIHLGGEAAVIVPLPDQDGMRAIGAAIAALVSNPAHRILFTEALIIACASANIGLYIVVDDALTTVERVDRVDHD